MYVYIYGYTNICLYLYICINVVIYISMYVHMYENTYICKYFFNRSGRVSQISDDILSQNERLRSELENLQKELFAMQQEQVKLKNSNRIQYNTLINDICKALQVRDAALVTLGRLESYCNANHLDISNICNFSVN